MCLELYIENKRFEKDGELNLTKENIHKQIVRVAETDIVCYKMIEVYGRKKGEEVLRTPYQGTRVELNKTYTAEGIEDLYSEVDDDFMQIEVGSGFIHSFQEFEDAMEDVLDYGYGNIVVKCIIPKGTEYIKGMFDSYYGYASKKIVYTNTIVFIDPKIDDDEYGVYMLEGKAFEILCEKYDVDGYAKDYYYENTKER